MHLFCNFVHKDTDKFMILVIYTRKQAEEVS